LTEWMLGNLSNSSHIMKNTLIACILCCFLAACNQPPQSTKELLEANLNATGGVDNWMALKTLKKSYQSIIKVGQNTVETDVIQYQALPQKQKTETYTNQELTNLTISTEKAASYFKFEDGQAIGFSAIKPEEVIIKQEAKWLKEERLFQFEKITWNGKGVYQLFDKITGDKYLYCQDSYLLLAHLAESAYGKSTTIFSDFRSVAGLTFPFSAVQGIPSSTYSKTISTSNIVINPTFDSDVFEEDKSWVTLVKGGSIPSFELPVFGETAKKLTNQDFKGKVVLVDFWATWCKPCLAEFPNIQRAYDKYHQNGFEVVSVSLDQNESALKRFLSEHHFPWANTIIKDGFKSDLAKRLQLASIPKPILVNQEGIVIAMDTEASGEALNKQLDHIFTKL